MAGEYYQKIKTHFLFPPTKGQDELISLLASYVFEEKTDDIFMIRGYAGTGKTSLVSALVRTLRDHRVPVVLMAPTGRAAKVLSAYSSYPASTIHRRIYFAARSHDGNMVLKLKENNYRNAVFLIDEASMIPDRRSNEEGGGRILLDDLMNYVFSGENCKLILVGDVAQLPPVGLSVSPALNSVYLKNAYKNDVRKFELTEVVRQKKTSGILENATRLREVMLSKNYAFPFFTTYGFKDVRRIDSYELPEEIMSAYDTVGQDDTVLITRSNKRAYQYNTAIRNRILQRQGEIEAGDILMIVKNNYYWLEEADGAGFLANGDLVEVMSLNSTEEKHGFRFADADVRLIDYPDEPEINVRLLLDTLSAEGPALSRSQNNELYNSVLDSYMGQGDMKTRRAKVRNDPYFNALQVKFAYAMTCHKTQGGQWDTVFIDQGFIADDKVDLDYLRWLYTAVTRATGRVFLINFPEEMFD